MLDTGLENRPAKEIHFQVWISVLSHFLSTTPYFNWIFVFGSLTNEFQCPGKSPGYNPEITPVPK